MKKYTGLLMVLFFIVHANAMHKVMWETNEEFIERTVRRVDDQDCIINAPTNESVEYCNILSFDKTKRAIIHFKWDRGSYAKLSVFNNYNKKMICELFLPEKYYALTSLDFNKQGTYLLLRGVWEYDDGMHRRRRMMIPLNAC